MTRTFMFAIPVGPVLAWLGQHPDQRRRYWCPKHPDQRPGGRPSAEVSRKNPCLLDCWSCRSQTTAAEFVSIAQGCSLEEGHARALAVAGEIDPVVRKQQSSPRPALSSSTLEEQLVREAVRAKRYDVDPVVAFVLDRGWPVEIVDYLRDSWGWTGGYCNGTLGKVVQPHRGHDGVLTGLRWRIPPGRCWRHRGEDGWCKDARGGSRFRQLYGAWRLRADAEEIVLAEGETDTVLVGWHLELSGIGVLGLPGASLPRGPRTSNCSGVGGP